MAYFRRRRSMLVSTDELSSLYVRRRTYEALSMLFADCEQPPHQLVATAAAAPCAWVGHSHLESAELKETAAAARVTWIAPADEAGVERERHRLFCEPGLDEGAAPVPTCESTYRSRPPHADRLAIESLYDAAGYSHRPVLGARTCCAGHISTELGFMAHALQQQMTGVRAATTHADEFLAQHLSAWAGLFAGKIHCQSENEVLRFSARALELFIEAEMALLCRRNPGALASVPG